MTIAGTLVGGQSNIVTDDQRNTVRIAVVKAPYSWTPSGLFNLIAASDERVLQVNRILFDKTFLLMSPGRDGTGYMPSGAQLDIDIPLSGKIIFNSASAASDIGDVFFIVMVSDSTVNPNPGFVSGNGSATLQWTE